MASSNEAGGGSHLPFRDAKLTHALKEAFAQGVNLSILINICEDSEHCKESISSLQFSQNCRKITNKQVSTALIKQRQAFENEELDEANT